MWGNVKTFWTNSLKPKQNAKVKREFTYWVGCPCCDVNDGVVTYSWKKKEKHKPDFNLGWT